MRLNKTVVTRLLCVLVISSVIVSCGEIMPLTFMDEVNEARSVKARYKEGAVQIHDIAAKYVPVGTRKQVALEFCEANGFKINPIRNKGNFDSKTYDESVFCSKHSLKWYLFGQEEIRVLFNIKDGVVAQVKGYIFLTVL